MPEFDCEPYKWTSACLSKKQQSGCGQLLESKGKLKNQAQKVRDELAPKIQFAGTNTTLQGSVVE